MTTKVSSELKDLQIDSNKLRQELVMRDRETLEKKRLLVESCVAYAIKASTRRHTHISLGIGVLAILITFLSVYFGTGMMGLIGIFFIGALTSFTFWKNPDKFLGKYMDGIREAALIQKAKDLQILGDLHQFKYDWPGGRAEIAPTPPANPDPTP